jgi:hypothetical protein
MTMSGELVLSLLHKEGAAALGKLLQEAGVGRLGAEGTPAEELAEGGNTVAAFVCHPQAWYLALWRRGCEGKGALYARLTDETRWARLGREKAPRAGRREPGTGGSAGQAAPASWSAEHARQVWYGEPTSPAAFREWLQAVLGHPATRRLVGATGGLLKASRWSGLMTREYVETFLARSSAGAIAPETVKDLLALDAQMSHARLFVRAESLAADLQQALQAMGASMPPALGQALAAQVDAGLADPGGFFDDDSRALVDKHEKFILRKFGYAGAGGDDAAADAGPRRKRAGAGAKRKARKKAEGEGESAGQSKPGRQRKKAAGEGKQAAGEGRKAAGGRKAGGRKKGDAAASGDQAAAAKPGKTKPKRVMLSDRPDPEDLID